MSVLEGDSFVRVVWMGSFGSVTAKPSIPVPKIPTVNSEFCRSLSRKKDPVVSDFDDKAVRRIYGGFGKRGYQSGTVPRPIPNETPTKYTFLKRSHRALSNGAISIAIRDPTRPQSDYTPVEIFTNINPLLIRCRKSGPVNLRENVSFGWDQ